MVSKVDDLHVYQRAYKVALEIHKLSLNLPKIEQYALADQIRRCSKSICANISEGFAKQSLSAAEFRRFLSIAIGSSNETKVWLQFCVDLEYSDKDNLQSLIKEYEEISKMLYGLLKNWKEAA